MGDESGSADIPVRLPRTHIPRYQLWEHLDRAADCSVTLLVAPAGAGKTLGVAGWLQRPPVDRRTAPLRWLQGHQALGPDEMVEALTTPAVGAARRDGSSDDPALVVVDDAHLLPAATHRAVDRLLQEEPDSIRALLLSRWDLPLSRLGPELLGNLAVIRGDVLKLTETEAASLVAEHARTKSPAIVDAISRHAGGWCGAVVLDARAIAASPDPMEAARRCTEGRARFGDRIASAALASLSPRVRHMLLCLTGEINVTPASATHLSGDREAGEMLEDLERMGILVTRVPRPLPAPRSPGSATDQDEEARTVHYRIHPLLVEVARRRLVAGGAEADRARASVNRAVQMDRVASETGNAIGRLIAVQGFQDAAVLIAQDGLDLALRGDSGALIAFARRHEDLLHELPSAWFALAVERWLAGATADAMRWLDRCTASDTLTPEERACAQLMSARLDLRVARAVAESARVAAAHACAHDTPPTVTPLLLSELGAVQGWLGDLEDAEANLSRAIALGRLRDLPAVTDAAASHLAMVRYMLGREAVTTDAGLPPLRQSVGRPASPAATKLALVTALARSTDLPLQPAPALSSAFHPADRVGEFWQRILNARAALAECGVVDARRVLDGAAHPPDDLDLARHLQASLLVERALYAALAADRTALKACETELAGLDLTGEAALVAGLNADLEGARARSAEQFAIAAESATFEQPPTRAIALVAQAQLVDALGDVATAHRCLSTALAETAVRRNGLPFLGWLRQGTPIAEILRSLDPGPTDAWASEVVAAMAQRAGIAATIAASTPSPWEEITGHGHDAPPALSVREREVLQELARGSTYADIGATLFVSENTVKTHVSNLYAKLGVSRRSQALAVARTRHLV